MSGNPQRQLCQQAIQLMTNYLTQQNDPFKTPLFTSAINCQNLTGLLNAYRTHLAGSDKVLFTPEIQNYIRELTDSQSYQLFSEIFQQILLLEQISLQQNMESITNENKLLEQQFKEHQQKLQECYIQNIRKTLNEQGFPEKYETLEEQSKNNTIHIQNLENELKKRERKIKQLESQTNNLRQMLQMEQTTQSINVEIRNNQQPMQQLNNNSKPGQVRIKMEMHQPSRQE